MLGLADRISSLGKNWGWFLFAGIAYVVFGLIAFSWPVSSTVGLTFALGVLFILSGAVHLVEAIKMRKEAGAGSHFFLSIIALAAGVLMLRYPASGMAGIAIAMAFYFFVSAGAKAVVAFGMRPHKGWGWALMSAVASFVLGAYIIATFPVSALWVPGLLLGLEFLFHGASLIGFSFDLKKVRSRVRNLTDEVTERRRAA